jgi:hypothetical protein
MSDSPYEELALRGLHIHLDAVDEANARAAVLAALIALDLTIAAPEALPEGKWTLQCDAVDGASGRFRVSAYAPADSEIEPRQAWQWIHTLMGDLRGSRIEPWFSRDGQYVGVPPMLPVLSRISRELGPGLVAELSFHLLMDPDTQASWAPAFAAWRRPAKGPVIGSVPGQASAPLRRALRSLSIPEADTAPAESPRPAPATFKPPKLGLPPGTSSLLQ